MKREVTTMKMPRRLLLCILTAGLLLGLCLMAVSAATTVTYKAKTLKQGGADAGYVFTGRSGAVDGYKGTCVDPWTHMDNKGKASATKLSNTSQMARVAYYCQKHGYSVSSTKKLYGKPRSGVIAHALALARVKEQYRTKKTASQLERELKSQGWDSTSLKAYKKLYKAAMDGVGKSDVPDNFKMYFLSPTNGKQDGVVWKLLPVGSGKVVKVSTNANVTTLDGYRSFAGVEYTLYKEDKKTKAGTFKLKKDGVSNVIGGLTPGKYWIKESKTNAYYKADASWHSAEIKSNKETVFRVSDVPATTSATIVKTEKNGNDLPEGSYFDFELVNTQNSNIRYKIHVVGDGTPTAQATQKDMYAGTYLVREVENNSEMRPEVGQKVVTIPISGTGVISWVNEKPDEMDLSLLKSTDDGGEVAGFTFKVEGVLYNHGTLSVSKLKSEAAPAITLSEELAEQYEEPEGWTVDEEDLSALNTAAKERREGSYKVTMRTVLQAKEGREAEDMEASVKIRVTLKGAEFNAQEGTYETKIKNKEERTVEKEGYTITCSDFDWHGAATVYRDVDTGEAYTLMTTDAFGRGIKSGRNVPYLFNRDGIYYGKFTATEMLTEEQAKRYRQPEPQVIEVAEGSDAEFFFEVENVAKRTPVLIRKTCSNGQVEGISFRLTGKTAWGEDVDLEGMTDEEGLIDFGDVYAGHYVLEETGFDAVHYVNTHQMEGYDNPAVALDVTGEEEEPISVTFENQPLTSLYIAKIDGETADFLDGAEFELDEEGTRVAQFRIIKKEDGSAGVEMIWSNGVISGPKEQAEAEEPDEPEDPNLQDIDGDDVIDAGSDPAEDDPSPQDDEEEPIEEGEEDAEYDPETMNWAVICNLTVGKKYTLKELKAPQGGYVAAGPVDFTFEDPTFITVKNYIPEIGTVALADATKEHIACAARKLRLTDTVSYRHLSPGEVYTMKGTVMVLGSGSGSAPAVAPTHPLFAGGKNVTATKTFRASETGDGEVKVPFTFDARECAGMTLVIFEECYAGKSPKASDTPVADHQEPLDKGQTIYIPKLKTTATSNGKHLVKAGKITIKDVVAYKNLIPGKTYTLSGVVMDKKTRKPVTNKGKKVTGTATFVPEKRSGTQEIAFTVDTRKLKGRSLVVFEELTLDGHLVGYHKDFKDKGQTVKIKGPKIGFVVIPGENGNGFGLVGLATGDPQSALIWFVLLIAAASGAALLIARRLRREEESECSE